MYHYKIGDFECDEGDEIIFYHGGKGLVFSPDEAREKYPDCSTNPSIWVYIFDYQAGRVYGFRPDVHQIKVIKKAKITLCDSSDVCKKCGAPGKRFPMCCRCTNCGEVIWGI